MNNIVTKHDFWSWARNTHISRRDMLQWIDGVFFAQEQSILQLFASGDGEDEENRIMPSQTQGVFIGMLSKYLPCFPTHWSEDALDELFYFEWMRDLSVFRYGMSNGLGELRREYGLESETYVKTMTREQQEQSTLQQLDICFLHEIEAAGDNISIYEYLSILYAVRYEKAFYVHRHRKSFFFRY
jgi:hypothetical protein